MNEANHVALSELRAALPSIVAAPSDSGIIELIVRRPEIGAREVLEIAELDVAVGLVGDTWHDRPSSRMPDGLAHPDMQITIMNSRAIQLIARTRDRWALAGDQFYADFDISESSLPGGSQLHLGTAIVEVTDEPHTGCQKFKERFGGDALRWVNDREGRSLRLRGVNCKVVRGGSVRAGDVVSRIVEVADRS